jgi:hypothetical protein
MNSASSARFALAGAGLIALSFVLFAHSALSMKQCTLNHRTVLVLIALQYMLALG